MSILMTRILVLTIIPCLVLDPAWGGAVSQPSPSLAVTELRKPFNQQALTLFLSNFPRVGLGANRAAVFLWATAGAYAAEPATVALLPSSQWLNTEVFASTLGFFLSQPHFHGGMLLVSVLGVGALGAMTYVSESQVNSMYRRVQAHVAKGRTDNVYRELDTLLGDIEKLKSVPVKINWYQTLLNDLREIPDLGGKERLRAVLYTRLAHHLNTVHRFADASSHADHALQICRTARIPANDFIHLVSNAHFEKGFANLVLWELGSTSVDTLHDAAEALIANLDLFQTIEDPRERFRKQQPTLSWLAWVAYHLWGLRPEDRELAEEVDRLVDHSLQRNVHDPRSQILQGILYVEKGDFTSAIPFFEEAAKSNPDNTTLRGSQLYAAIQAGKEWKLILDGIQQSSLRNVARWYAEAQSKTLQADQQWDTHREESARLYKQAAALWGQCLKSPDFTSLFPSIPVEIRRVVDMLRTFIRAGNQAQAVELMTYSIRRTQHPGMLELLAQGTSDAPADWYDELIGELKRFEDAPLQEQAAIFGDALNAALIARGVEPRDSRIKLLRSLSAHTTIDVRSVRERIQDDLESRLSPITPRLRDLVLETPEKPDLIESLLRRAQDHPQDEKLLGDLADELLFAGRNKEAIVYYLKLLDFYLIAARRAEPESIPWPTQKGAPDEVYLKITAAKKKYSQFGTELNRVRGLAKAITDTLSQVGVCYLRLASQHPDHALQARNYYQAALQLAENNETIPAWLRADVGKELAGVLIHAADWDGALTKGKAAIEEIDRIDRVLKTQEGDFGLPPLEASTYRQYRQEESEKNNHRKALAHCYVGIAYARREAWNEAVAHLEASLEFDHALVTRTAKLELVIARYHQLERAESMTDDVRARLATLREDIDHLTQTETGESSETLRVLTAKVLVEAVSFRHEGRYQEALTILCSLAASHLGVDDPENIQTIENLFEVMATANRETIKQAQDDPDARWALQEAVNAIRQVYNAQGQKKSVQNLTDAWETFLIPEVEFPVELREADALLLKSHPDRAVERLMHFFTGWDGKVPQWAWRTMTWIDNQPSLTLPQKISLFESIQRILAEFSRNRNDADALPWTMKASIRLSEYYWDNNQYPDSKRLLETTLDLDRQYEQALKRHSSSTEDPWKEARNGIRRNALNLLGAHELNAWQTLRGPRDNKPLERAIKHFRDALALLPEVTDASDSQASVRSRYSSNSALAHYLCMVNSSGFEANRFHQISSQLAERALSFDIENDMSWWVKGQIAMLQGDNTTALSDFETALACPGAADDPGTLASLIRAATALGQLEKAENTLARLDQQSEVYQLHQGWVAFAKARGGKNPASYAAALAAWQPFLNQPHLAEPLLYPGAELFQLHGHIVTALVRSNRFSEVGTFLCKLAKESILPIGLTDTVADLIPDDRRTDFIAELRKADDVPAMTAWLEAMSERWPAEFAQAKVKTPAVSVDEATQESSPDTPDEQNAMEEWKKRPLNDPGALNSFFSDRKWSKLSVSSRVKLFPRLAHFLIHKPGAKIGALAPVLVRLIQETSTTLRKAQNENQDLGNEKILAELRRVLVLELPGTVQNKFQQIVFDQQRYTAAFQAMDALAALLQPLLTAHDEKAIGAQIETLRSALDPWRKMNDAELAPLLEKARQALASIQTQREALSSTGQSLMSSMQSSLRQLDADLSKFEERIQRLERDRQQAQEEAARAQKQAVIEAAKRSLLESQTAHANTHQRFLEAAWKALLKQVEALTDLGGIASIEDLRDRIAALLPWKDYRDRVLAALSKSLERIEAVRRAEELRQAQAAETNRILQHPVLQALIPNDMHPVNMEEALLLVNATLAHPDLTNVIQRHFLAWLLGADESDWEIQGLAPETGYVISRAVSDALRDHTISTTQPGDKQRRAGALRPLYNSLSGKGIASSIQMTGNPHFTYSQPLYQGQHVTCRIEMMDVPGQPASRKPVLLRTGPMLIGVLLPMPNQSKNQDSTNEIAIRTALLMGSGYSQADAPVIAASHEAIKEPFTVYRSAALTPEVEAILFAALRGNKADPQANRLPLLNLLNSLTGPERELVRALIEQAQQSDLARPLNVEAMRLRAGSRWILTRYAFVSRRLALGDDQISAPQTPSGRVRRLNDLFEKLVSTWLASIETEGTAEMAWEKLDKERRLLLLEQESRLRREQIEAAQKEQELRRQRAIEGGIEGLAHQLVAFISAGWTAELASLWVDSAEAVLDHQGAAISEDVQNNLHQLFGYMREAIATGIAESIVQVFYTNLNLLNQYLFSATDAKWWVWLDYQDGGDVTGVHSDHVLRHEILDLLGDGTWENSVTLVIAAGHYTMGYWPGQQLALISLETLRESINNVRHEEPRKRWLNQRQLAAKTLLNLLQQHVDNRIPPRALSGSKLDSFQLSPQEIRELKRDYERIVNVPKPEDLRDELFSLMRKARENMAAKFLWELLFETLSLDPQAERSIYLFRTSVFNRGLRLTFNMIRDAMTAQFTDQGATSLTPVKENGSVIYPEPVQNILDYLFRELGLNEQRGFTGGNGIPGQPAMPGIPRRQQKHHPAQPSAAAA